MWVPVGGATLIVVNQPPVLDLCRYVVEINRKGWLKTKFYDKSDYFNFRIVNSPFIYGNISESLAYEVNTSQLIWYTGACGSYQNAIDRALLLKI